ncbi:hypothetical protein DI53_3561 [Sphingobacterium deserti]|uniref:Uncharacterized protein n=1 Tax=Sphingobacterium deserti TaxID=1229276 RepID=A0A0B8SZ07_9SPHI|nr:hypothetical protein DI53_3561 [Sphingobacterium deserti]
MIYSSIKTNINHLQFQSNEAVVQSMQLSISRLMSMVDGFGA